MQSDFKNFKWDELIKSLPVEKTEGDKVDMNIKLKGLNDIDPFYDDIKKLQFLEDNKVNIKFVIGEKDKKLLSKMIFEFLSAGKKSAVEVLKKK